MTEPKPDPVEELAQLMGRVDARLPDTIRARGAAALVERLGREAVGEPVPSAPRRGGRAWPFLWASAGALAVSAVLLAWSGLRPPAQVVIAPTHQQNAPKAVEPQAVATAPAVPAVGNAPVEERAILRILTANARSTEPARARLQGKAGTDTRATLADCGRLVLRGAGQVAVEENAVSGIVLGLQRGTLLVSFDHDSGRSLVIRTKDAVVRVTGTVFAVRVGEGPTQVSVSRGSVEVETSGLPVSVTAGKRWQVGAKTLSALDMELVSALRELRASEAGRSSPPVTRGQLGAVQPLDVPAPQSEALPAVRSLESPAPNGDAETLYRIAEQALVAGHAEVANAQLRGLLGKYPDHALVGPAMYELGRLAFAARSFITARAEFANLRNSRLPGATRFHEPAAFFICRSDQELGKRVGAIACFEQYRAEFPNSPHSGDALAALATLHLDGRDCRSALPLMEAYLNRFPGGSQAGAMSAARANCTHPTIP